MIKVLLADEFLHKLVGDLHKIPNSILCLLPCASYHTTLESGKVTKPII